MTRLTTRCRNDDGEAVMTAVDAADRDCTEKGSQTLPWMYGTVVGSATISQYPDLYPGTTGGAFACTVDTSASAQTPTVTTGGATKMVSCAVASGAVIKTTTVASSLTVDCTTELTGSEVRTVTFSFLCNCSRNAGL
eukprot:SAG31_NODE_4567_length_3129_cov_33.878218_2_plen_137_part_00